MLRLQAPLPDDYTLASARRARRPHRGGQGDARRPARDPRPPLPARRGDPLGRRGRRLVQARPLRGGQPPGRPTSCSAACTSWPSRPTCSPPTTSGSSSPTSTPAARWPTWPTSTRSRRRGTRSAAITAIDRVVPITYMNSVRRAEGVRRPARRRGVHVVERAGRPRVGARARATRCSSSPTSTSAATPASTMGYARSRHARVEPAPRLRRARGARGQGRDAAALEGPLLGAPALPARARRRGPRRAPRRRGDRAPRVRARRRRGRRPRRLDRADPGVGREPRRPARRSRSAPRSTWCSASRASTPTRRSSRSTR